jgi:hypothetical protein
LVDATRRHAPGVVSWWYSQRNPKRLSRVAPEERCPWAAAVAAPSPPTNGPRLAPTIGPETPRLKPGGAAAFRPAGKNARPSNEPPKVVVRPGGGIGIRRLRLVGEDLARPMPAPPGNGVPPAGPLPPDSVHDQDEDASNRKPLLTEEELQMLLGEDLPATEGGPETDRSRH